MSLNQEVSLELLLKNSLDLSPDCFCVYDNEVVLYCNDHFADIFGTSKEKAIGSKYKALLRQAWLSQKGVIIDTDDFDAWLSDLDKAHDELSISQFETDLTDGRWFRMSRTTLACGYTVVFGVDITELKRTQKALEEANKHIEQLANTDQLTGVNNRRAFESIAKHEVAIATRYKHPLSLLTLDIDFFKRINDNYGHEAGDDVLKQFTQLCSGIIRESDILCRIGGEEFVILLPVTESTAARKLAERIRSRIADNEFYLSSQNKKIPMTVSIGISQRNEFDESIDEVLARADSALYQAKNNGRNQVCHSIV